MKKCLILFLLMLISCSSFAQWNNWKSAKSVRKSINKAQNEGKSYFSQFHVYDVRGKDISTSDFRKQTDEVLYIYALDFYYASGTYFGDEYKAKHRKNIVELVKRQWRDNKAIPSFSWHLENPYVTSDFGEYMGCNYYYNKRGANYPDEHRHVIREILTGEGGTRCGEGRYNGSPNSAGYYENPKIWFDDRCKEVASIINELVDDNGKPIPIIFRLWHECESTWFWWSSTMATPEEYKQFFQLTEKTIKKYAKKSQILWAYCPNRGFSTEDDYMLRYPGDRYVDFIGYDDYSIADPKSFETELAKAKLITQIALKHKKIAGLFESANKIESEADSYFKECLIPILADPEVSLGFVQLWSSGIFSSIKQYEDRKWFLQQPNILTIK